MIFKNTINKQNYIIISTYMYEIQDYKFLHSKQCDPKQSQDQQLDWTDFTKYCPVGN